MGSSDRLLASELVDDIEFLAARARSVGTTHANELLAPLGLRVRSYAVLALACSGLAPSQRELASFLSLDASQIVALVDDLTRIEARDRRSNAIAATPAGHELYKLAQEAARTGQDAALRALDSAERDTLRALLKRVAFEA